MGNAVPEALPLGIRPEKKSQRKSRNLYRKGKNAYQQKEQSTPGGTLGGSSVLGWQGTASSSPGTPLLEIEGTHQSMHCLSAAVGGEIRDL